MQHGDQAMRSVVRQMGISGVALCAFGREIAVQAAAPADLDHVAQASGSSARRYAGAEQLAAFGQPSSILRVPLTAGPSSSPVISRLIARRTARGAT